MTVAESDLPDVVTAADVASAPRRARPPALVIELRLEERPHVREEAITEAQAERLRAWIRSQPELAAIASKAVRLMAGRAA